MKPNYATSAYNYPLLIKHLWHRPLHCDAQQEIVSGNNKRFSYRQSRDRIGCIADGLTSIGLKPRRRFRLLWNGSSMSRF